MEISGLKSVTSEIQNSLDGLKGDDREGSVNEYRLIKTI
jgi:hypothetical protein